MNFEMFFGPHSFSVLGPNRHCILESRIFNPVSSTFIVLMRTIIKAMQFTTFLGQSGF